MSLWTVGADGSGWRRLVEDTVAIIGPRWSPSSDAVYYMRGDELRRVDVNSHGGPGGPFQSLQAGLEFSYHDFPPEPSLTSDGGKLVFTPMGTSLECVARDLQSGSSNLYLHSVAGYTMELARA